LRKGPEWRKGNTCITLRLGNYVVVSVQVGCADPSLGTAETITLINATEAALRARFPEIRWSFFEPDDSP